MSLITLRDVSVTFANPLFAGLSFTLNKGDRLGLIALNGRGKTTALALIAGRSDPTGGEITTARGLRIALVAQHPNESLLAQTLWDAVLSALDPDAQDTESWRAHIVLEDLEVPEELWYRTLSQLSGGWQRVALLARAWITEPDVLLLDEPTNHLDLHRIGVLQRWLSGPARGTPLVIASHDRAFLDAVTTRTLFLRPEASPAFPLPYSRARAALDEADAADARRFENDISKAKQMRKQAEKLKNVGINSGSDLLLTKTKQLTARAEKLEASARPAHQDGSSGAIRLTNAGTHAKALIALDQMEVSAGGRVLYRAGPLWVERGDRVVLLGANGAGKSRLMESVIHGSDAIRIAPSARLGVSDQGLSQLDAFPTPMEAVTRCSDIGDRAARAHLAGAGIAITAQDASIPTLSGGQKARLAMLLLRLAQPNLYLLDEPTNHLDIEGQEALEHELIAHGATALLVSHDRAFVRQVGTRFWQITGKRLVEVDSPEPFFDSQLG
ncbi:MAG: ABC transporter [Rhodobacterales bacterium]|nr:MAG: ABC transporter [Rhodobacterales bacterium]